MRNKGVNQDWTLPDSMEWKHVTPALLMDIRDELQKLNRLLNCVNFLTIPGTLRSIRRNTTKSRKKKVAK